VENIKRSNIQDIYAVINYMWYLRRVI